MEQDEVASEQPGVIPSDRQAREIEYHRDHAHRHAERVEAQVALDVLNDKKRRWWNGYWRAYDILLTSNLCGKKVLVPGCGFGDDAIRIALMGAKVYASDLSSDLVKIARIRAQKAGAHSINFDIMPAEALSYAENTFDAAFYNDILHHVDIARALSEARRVLKGGAIVVINELYTHSALQQIRNSRFVNKNLYPRMIRLIYGTDKPYVTEDERKLNEKELNALLALLEDINLDFFLMVEGRLCPTRWPLFSKIDHAILRLVGQGGGRLLAGRFVLRGALK